MSNRLILLSDTGAFLEWGPGCIISVTDPFPGVGEGWTVWAGHHDGVNLGEFASEKQAQAACALFLQAIIAAPDGALLRWDNERQQVVDELEVADSSFGDYDPALLDPFAIDTNPIHCPVCGAEMVMDYDGGELVCSSDDCDARQPIP